MREIGTADYIPVLRFKRGEYEAYHRLEPQHKSRIVAHAVFPSLAEPDKEKRRPLSRDEIISVQVGRIAKYWAGRPLFADLRFLKFELGPKGRRILVS